MYVVVIEWSSPTPSLFPFLELKQAKACIERHADKSFRRATIYRHIPAVYDGGEFHQVGVPVYPSMIET